MKTIKKKDSYFRLKVNFAPNKEVYTRNRIKDVMGWLHSSILGKNNQYHDTFSNYSVSDMLGGRLINGVLQYPEGGYVYISSIDKEFISKVIDGCYANTTFVRDMKCLGIEPQTITVHSDYDVVYTETPIYLKDFQNKDKNRLITVKDDDFIDVLQERSRKKLIVNGLSEDIANTLIIEPLHFEKAKVKKIYVGNVMSPASVCQFVIKGDTRARCMLYQLGMGISTGCGFGCVRVSPYKY